MFWLLLLGVTGSSILGVAHNKQSLYLADTFTCLDGSLDLPSTFINDNFCDCPDGSDEPGTSACYNSQFYCAEEGYSPYYIPASQVNDNICDCCDGSDESPGICPHNCKDKKEKAQESLKNRFKAWQEGLLAKLTIVAHNKLEGQTRAEEIKKLRLEKEEKERQKKASNSVVRYLNEHQGCSDVSKFETIENSLDEAISLAESKLRELEETEKFDIGTDGEFSNLVNQCTDYVDGKYTYEICFYKEAKQKENHHEFSLGNWHGFDSEYRSISFTGGDRCHAGPDRSLTVILECGPNLRLYGIDEPDRCVYTAKLSLPGACKLKQF